MPPVAETGGDPGGCAGGCGWRSRRPRRRGAAAPGDVGPRPADVRDRARRQPLRGAPPRRDPRPPRRPAPGAPVPRHLSARDDGGRRAGPALDGVRAALRPKPPRLRRLHQPERRHPRRAVPDVRRATATGSTPRPSASSSRSRQPFDNHNGGQLQIGPRRAALHLPRRRRIGGRPEPERPEQGPALRPSSGSTRESPTPAPRCTPTACETPGGSRSTGRPAACGSATSARTRGRRSTTSATARPAGTNFGWSFYEGRSVFKTQPIDRIEAAVPGRRLPPRRLRRRQLLDHRRLRLPRRARSRGSRASTSTPTSARAGSGRSRRAAAGRGSRT